MAVVHLTGVLHVRGFVNEYSGGGGRWQYRWPRRTIVEAATRRPVATLPRHELGWKHPRHSLQQPTWRTQACASAEEGRCRWRQRLRRRRGWSCHWHWRRRWEWWENGFHCGCYLMASDSSSVVWWRWWGEATLWEDAGNSPCRKGHG